MPDIYYVINQFVSQEQSVIPSEERGHQFGDGVYEVVRVYGGRPFLLSWHLERLDRSCRAVGITNPHSAEAWTELIGEAIRRSGYSEAAVYWQVTRGAAPRSHLFPHSQPNVTLTVRQTPVSDRPSHAKLLCLPDERFANAWVKTLNLLPNVIAKESAKQSGCQDALLVRDGIITEGSSANAWFVRDGKLFTHPDNRYILGGVTRRFLLKLATDLQIPVVEQPLSLDDLDSVSGVFLSGTTIEMLNVGEVVVDAAVLPELRHLPAAAPTELVRVSETHQQLWSHNGEEPLITALQQAFTSVVERVAEGEPFVL